MDNNEQSAPGFVELEDLSGQGIRNESVGSETSDSESQGNKSDNKFEMGAEIAQEFNLKKAFTSVRDLDVDALGKNKTGYDFNLFGKK